MLHLAIGPQSAGDVALPLAKDCAASYRKAGLEVRKMWSRAFFRTIRVRDGGIADFVYEEPFAHSSVHTKGSMVEVAERCVNQLSVLEALRRQETG